ncbi:MAG: DNA polymerase domain-containing protein [Chloroflexi bacterium]|nr:DNA polymerase domain-containing protein [Chloroflexota bacterium]
MPVSPTVLEIDGRAVAISNPDKVFFPRTGHTKLDLVNYYLAVADGAIRGVAGRPMALKRFVHGAEQPPFFQKRVPLNHPPWIETVELSYPSGRTASEIVIREPAQLAWVLNLGCIDLNPHPVRADDLDHPDELRVDLDPLRGVPWPQVLEVALVARQVLTEFGLTAWPKTSGNRGFHVYARIERRWTFREVRRAGLALAREVEARAPELATSRWWKEERHGVFVDYNQNARDRTTCSVYSVRPTPDARVSTPLLWDEVPSCNPNAFTLDTVPARYERYGDLAAGIDESIGSIEPLLELADRQEAAGATEAPRAGAVPEPAPGKDVGPTGRRRSSMPLIEVARAETEAEALAGLERWKARHGEVWSYLQPADVLIDNMRGRSTTWSRIRLNLRHVPEAERPSQEPLDVDYDPWAGMVRPTG